MAGRMNLKVDLDSGAAKHLGQSSRVVGRHDGVVVAGGDEHAFAVKAGRGGGFKHDHGADKGGGRQRLRAQEQEAGGDVGTVGKAERGQARRVDAVVRLCGGEEFRQFMLNDMKKWADVVKRAGIQVR